MKYYKSCLIQLTIFVLFSLGNISGCAWWSTKEAEITPQEAFDKADALLQKKKYEKAASAFKQFKEDYPLSHLTPLAELKTADALYYDKNFAEAIVLYDEFKKLHPLHPEIPNAIYQLGMCHFKQIQSFDRDQTETEKAIEQFRYLIENYPQSPYVADANRDMQTCLKRLADHEFYIANFYLRTHRYKAALGRFEGILQKYPGLGLDDQVQRSIIECQKEIQKEDQKKKEQEAKEERKRKEKEEKKKDKAEAI
jgi:outer membrane protein assembly factor BamD